MRTAPNTHPSTHYQHKLDMAAQQQHLYVLDAYVAQLASMQGPSAACSTTSACRQACRQASCTDLCSTACSCQSCRQQRRARALEPSRCCSTSSYRLTHRYLLGVLACQRAGMPPDGSCCLAMHSALACVLPAANCIHHSSFWHYGRCATASLRATQSKICTSISFAALFVCRSSLFQRQLSQP